MGALARRALMKALRVAFFAALTLLFVLAFFTLLTGLKP